MTQRLSFRSFATLLFASAVSLAAGSEAFADPVTWTITGGTFTDGGTLTGSFVFDADTVTFSQVNLTVSGGNTTAFPAFTYTDSNSRAQDFGVAQGHVVYLFTVTGSPTNRQLILAFVPNLTNAGGPVSLFVSAGNAAELNNRFADERDISGGTANGVPVPGLTLFQWFFFGN